jgi:uncharacterized protein with GYD domain
MNTKSLLIASAIVVGVAMPATAQQSSATHRYATFFKYTDQAIKAMADNPQDRTSAVAKLSEAFGGKLETIYFFPLGGEFDGVVISQEPSDASLAASNFLARSAGTTARLQAVPVASAEEFKAIMERTKQGGSAYSPPGR